MQGAETVLFGDDTNILIEPGNDWIINKKIKSRMNELQTSFHTKGLVKNGEKSIAMSLHT